MASDAIAAESRGDDVRFVDICPQCGYSLIGSPDEGICPECGQAYDQSLIILHGDARGKMATLTNGATKSFLLKLAAPTFWLAYFWFFSASRSKGTFIVA